MEKTRTSLEGSVEDTAEMCQRGARNYMSSDVGREAPQRDKDMGWGQRSHWSSRRGRYKTNMHPMTSHYGKRRNDTDGMSS
jgi:hypothetical protein